MTSNSAPLIFLVSNFTSLFEVAVGLNLVFAVWDGLRNQAVEKFKQLAEELDKTLELRLGNKYKNSRCATKFAEKQNCYVTTLEKLSKRAKFVGLIITAFLLVLLAYIGYFPDTSVSLLPITLLVLLATSVSPAFLIIGNYCVIDSKKKLEEFVQQQTTALDDVQEFAGDLSI